MAKKRIQKGASKSKGRKKYFNGGQAYALPTSANATTANMMGLGDPALLQRDLDMANAMVTEQQQRMRAQEEMRTKVAEQESKDNLNSAYTRSQELISSTFPRIGTTAVNTARVGMGTANAAQVAKASGDSTATLLGNLGNYGTQTTGQAARAGIKAGLKSAGPNALVSAGGTGLNLVGAGVKHLSNDNDPTRMNFGETTGTLMQGAGTGLGLAGTLGLMGAVPGIGWAAAGLGALGYGVHALIQKKKAKEEQEIVDRQNAIANQQMAIAQSEAFNKAFTKTGADLGYNVGNALTNSYIPSQQIMYAKTGGEMIRRADGSYSPRGLWDNIRANEGSGKKPTKEMLEQEKKIKAQEKKEGGIKVPGGKIQSLGGDAVKFVGQTHAQGGIMIDPQTEVENNETMDKVQMKGGGMSDYIFSEHLKLGGVSFAKRHERLLKNGANQKDIQQLAKLQEAIAAKEGKDENGPRGPERIMKDGGVKKYQGGDTPFAPVNQNFADYMNYQSYLQNLASGNTMSGSLSPADPNNANYTLAPEAASAIEYPGLQPRNEFGLYNLPGKEGEDKVNLTDFELQKAASPWFDWENFDPTNPEDVDRFQKEYNRLVGDAAQNVREDSYYGEQTTSARIPYKQKAVTAPKVPTGCPCDDGTYSSDCCKEEPGGETTEKETTGKERVPNRAWMAALPGLVGLGIDGNYPGARTMSPQMQRGVNLPRINLNAERAANSAMNVGMKRQLSNQLSGPAGVAASFASNQQARQQNLAIGNEEARGNKELMAQEASLNANIAGQNQAAFNQAGMFNARQLQDRDVNQFEQKLLLKKYKTDVLQQTAKDAMQYKFDERLARATDDTGSYIRFLQENPQFMQTMISQMNNTANTSNEKTTTAKSGGYIKRGNKLKRKKK